MKAFIPALFAAVSFSAALAAPATASETISVPAFRSVALHGGGHITLRHGDAQKVTMIEGDRNKAKFKVDSDGTLNIAPCEGICFGSYDLDVEIVTPAIKGVSIHGGGNIEAEGNFARQPALNVAIHGGGEIDVRRIPADHVSAAVHGGGDISVDAEKHLSAAVHGGGDILYWGHPTISSAIHGGGSVSSGS